MFSTIRSSRAAITSSTWSIRNLVRCLMKMVFSRTPAAVGWPGAQIGQHNDYVLREMLGLSTAEITALQTHKALE
jgi:crotonobetainyl-CoA:carnitine CoA-transferase CaiB-like acyl-CoA transferase